MKKALVMTFVLVLGLGFAAFADGALSGVWDTDVSLYPAAGVFGDFIKSFTSEVDFDYSIGGWVFGIESTFGLAGLTGMDFEADGTLGAFTFDLDIDFAPMIVLTEAYTYTDLQTASTCCDPVECDCWTWSSLAVKKTYTAGFDDMKAEVSVSIAGVSLGSVFFLEGNDTEVSETVTGKYYWLSQYPITGAVTPIQSGSCTFTDWTKGGAGWKFSASGNFGGATLTGLAYFNLKESHSYAYKRRAVFSDYFVKRGNYSLVCDDCIVRFTSAELLITDLSFACTSMTAWVGFDCCGFTDAKFLLEDVGLGCCWDLGFDFLIGFSDTSKTVSLDPQITFANACFTIAAEIDLTEDATHQEGIALTNIDIIGFALEYSWNGIAVTAKTSFDVTRYPILGSYGSGVIYGPTKMYVFAPATCYTYATYSGGVSNECEDECTVSNQHHSITNTGTGAGYYELVAVNCEKAKVWEEFSITIDGDACCGGDFEISAAFYMGDVYELADVEGTYFWRDQCTDADADSYYKFLDCGTDDLDTPSDPFSAWSAGCNCCPCDCCICDLDAVSWKYGWTGTSTRLFDWVETDVDVVVALSSAFDLTFGLDVTAWGWEDFTFGFEFTF